MGQQQPWGERLANNAHGTTLVCRRLAAPASMGTARENAPDPRPVTGATRHGLSPPSSGAVWPVARRAYHAGACSIRLPPRPDSLCACSRRRVPRPRFRGSEICKRHRAGTMAALSDSFSYLVPGQDRGQELAPLRRKRFTTRVAGLPRACLPSTTLDTSRIHLLRAAYSPRTHASTA